MNYELLLKKYMAHILDCEGMTYISLINSAGCNQSFSHEELAVLDRLEDEVFAKGIIA